MEKVGIVSLGCCKNRVDTEIMLGRLVQSGYEITGDESQADIIIINTCGFIDAAKQEAIDTIFEMAQYKQTGSLKKLVVTGCFAKRYKDAILSEMPEVDIVLGLSQYNDIVSHLKGKGRIAETDVKQVSYNYASRELSTPFYTAYIRIADGCDNCCSYCAIPSIRGAYTSRTMEDILGEIEVLVKRGVKEFILIAQDTTRYGIDLYGEYRLKELIQKAAAISGVKWLRVMYMYPDLLNDALIDVMLTTPNVLKYFEVPLQHISPNIISSMNRRGEKAQIQRMLDKIRSHEESVIRTTFMLGFPGETDEHVDELIEFMLKNKFDRVGAFAYSQEENTPAFDMPQIDEEVKQQRYERVMLCQQEIAEQMNQKRIGKTYEVLTEGKQDGVYFGRSYAEAPEIDPYIFFSGHKEYLPGEFVNVLITNQDGYDLIGEAQHEFTK